MLAHDAVRLPMALGWVVAGFLFDLGVGLEWGEVWRLADGTADIISTETIIARATAESGVEQLLVSVG